MRSARSLSRIFVIGFSGASSFQTWADTYFPSAELKPRKTYGVALMKTLHCLIAGLRLAFSNAASRIAIPLLVVGMALVFVQPCAALSFQFEETGSMAVARDSGKAGTIAKWPGPRRRRARQQQQPSRERGTVRSGDRNLDGHGQPGHRPLVPHRYRCCPTARCSLQAAFPTPRARNSTIRLPGRGPLLAASRRRGRPTRRRSWPTARCLSQAVLAAVTFSGAPNSTIL